MSEVYRKNHDPGVQECHNALDTAIMTSGIIFGIKPKAVYHMEFTNEDEWIDLPVKLAHLDKGNVVIKAHIPSMIDRYATKEPRGSEYGMESMQEIEDIADNILFFEDTAKIHIVSAVLPHMLLTSINPRDIATVKRLGYHMRSADTLLEDVSKQLTRIGEFEVRIREAILRKSEDEIAEINRYRLALGSICYYEETTGLEQQSDRECVDFSNRITSVFVERFAELPSQLDAYRKIANSLGVDDHNAEKCFMEEVSALEFAGAFPMEITEISMLAGYVNKLKS